MKHLVLALTILFTPLLTSAQFDLSTALNSINNNLGGSAPTIELQPSYPGPFSEATATINDFTEQHQASGVVWYIDGKKMEDKTNQREIDFVTGDTNVPMTLTAVLEIPGKNPLTIEHKIKPVYLDIIAEPQTRVPSFYKGRPLPSLGSEVNLTAVINGGQISPENLNYYWKVNNKVVESGSTKGKYKISFTFGYDAENIVSLIVSNGPGQVVARRDVLLPSVRPKMVFYEINPLYGPEHLPIKGSLSLISNAGSIQAEPYFLDILTYNQPSLTEWKIDGARSPNINPNPYQLTLMRQGGRGKSRVDFHVRSLDGALQGAQGSVNINY